MDQPDKKHEADSQNPESRSEETAEKQETQAQTQPEAAALETKDRPEPEKSQPGDEFVPELEPSPELKSALEEAIQSCEKLEQKKKQKEQEPARPSEEELKLKMEILDLKHRVRELEAELEKKVKEVRQNFEQGMAIKNQFEAYKNRIMKEKAEAFNYGHEPLLKELLTVVDNFERALEHARKPENFPQLKEGVELILRQMLQLLEKFGVTPIQALNAVFDPRFHEAMSQVSSTEHPDNTVVAEHSKGYMLKDRLLRPARVTISRNPDADKKPETGKDDSPPDEKAKVGEQEPPEPESKKTGGI